jgi:starch-binding outer membrane protein, SusD/RagB family
MRYLYIHLCFLIIFLTGCKKLIEVQAPPTDITGPSIYSSDENATTALAGLYTQLNKAGGLTEFNSIGVSLFCGLSADEFVLLDYGGSNPFRFYYQNNLNNNISFFWNKLYSLVFVANSAVEGLQASSSLSAAVKQQLIGEAKFTRAFLFYYLVNLYGDVPLVLSTDYKLNAVIKSSDVETVYKQIITDLEEAQELLSENFLKGDAISVYNNDEIERVRPTRWAASALLARVYLHNKEYSKAESKATLVINHTALFGLSEINDVFLKNSSEAIWQLQPVSNALNTRDGNIYVIPATGPSALNPVALNNDLINCFEVTDLRKTEWIGKVTAAGNTYYFPFKYKISEEVFGAPVNEYNMVLRLAEQYLIRAEARTQQENNTGAKSDIDSLRHRAGVSDYNGATDNHALMTAIQLERRKELFSEWGHRWFDLKRMNAADTVMTAAASQKGGVWETTDQLYPIPAAELLKNKNLIQNPGYR